jgi:nitrogenase molybdenum-iron protein alpha chain
MTPSKEKTDRHRPLPADDGRDHRQVQTAPAGQKGHALRRRLRPRHVIGAYEDLGMEVIGTGYEFAHNDDYDRTIKEMGDATLLRRCHRLRTGRVCQETEAGHGRLGHQGKYIFQKMGIPLRQMHSWDYSGPTATTVSRSSLATWTSPCPTAQEPDAPWKKVVALEKEGCLSFQK